jgi:superfamily II DNA or RNA helicase
MTMRVQFPNVLRIEEWVLGSPIRQVAERGWSVDGELVPFTRNKRTGGLFTPDSGGPEVIVTCDPKFAQSSDTRVVLLPKGDALTADLRRGTWLRHPHRVSAPDLKAESARSRASWTNAFHYITENADGPIIGLRKPQIGAIHAVHSHWSISRDVGTVVMPTGTGKTEVMLSVLVSAGCERLLVIVPTDALRTQLAGKFLSLGILKAPDSAILEPSALFPVVGTLTHIPASIEEVDRFFEQCQVIVTTSAIAGQCAEEVQQRMAHHCPFLFIDEAHHTEAPTWRAFKDHFTAQRILQFTATPFREDGRQLDGRIIYKYGLRMAQEDAYFRPIQFRSVYEFNPKRVDEAIAQVAVEQLRADVDKGHILMARVDSIRDAQRVFKIYEQYAEFKPVQLHTGIKSAKARDAATKAILTGESKIVVCVDMLGEGFDLPELKIAAFHDIRKTLAVTLQLAGRFTRVRSDLGDATFIANVADVNVRAELRKLYNRDPDWNVLLPELSDTLIGEQVALQTFLAGFTEFPEEIPLKTVRPACSTVVYKTKCERWTPENFREGIPGIASCAQVHPALNTEKTVLVVVTAKRLGLDWSDVETLYDWEWELYVLYWSEAKQLLFINSSANAGEYKALSRAVAGDDVTLIKGQDVFRAFAGITRMKLQNVGLSEQLGRNVRYTGRMGADVEQALTEVIKRKGRKSVLAGGGFENGRRATIGASRRGRVWSHQRAHIAHFLSWCDGVGTKLLDPTIDPDEVLKGTLSGEVVALRPAVMPIAVDWPEEMYKTPEVMWTITIDDVAFPLGEVSIDLVDPAVDGPLRISIDSETASAGLELELFEEDETLNYRFRVVDGTDVSIRRGDRAEPSNLAEFFYDQPPIIWFVDGASLEGNEHVPLKMHQPPYDAEKITVWDWTGTDIRKESQGPEKAADSVQARVIRELQKDASFTVIFDDDGKGELADVVGIRLLGQGEFPDAIDVELYHCKYAKGDAAGARVNDLYEVCGQSQKCISWMASVDRQTDMLTHLLRREAAAQERGISRFERGTMEDLARIREMSREREIRVKVFVVQPGLSMSRVSRDQLELLSVTENHLKETYQLPFTVIANA